MLAAATCQRIWGGAVRPSTAQGVVITCVALFSLYRSLAIFPVALGKPAASADI